MKPLLFFISLIFIISCHSTYSSVYHLETESARLIEAREFDLYWERCLSSSNQKMYNKIARNMSQAQDSYYPLHQYLSKLPCIDVKAMTGKELFVFCSKHSVQLVEYTKKHPSKGGTGEITKVEESTAYQFISKDSCIAYAVLNEKIDSKSGKELLVKEKGEWKFSEKYRDPYSNVVVAFMSFFLFDNPPKGYAICK